MLLFPQPLDSIDDGWTLRSESVAVADSAHMVIRAGVGSGLHLVEVELAGASEPSSGGEAVGSPGALGAGAGDPVSWAHLPPEYRWDDGPFSFRFLASWRDAAPSVAVSMRHLRSLRAHPQALVAPSAIDEFAPKSAGDSPASVLVMGTPEVDGNGVALEWRGWHVVADGSNDDGVRVLATHTRLQAEPSRALDQARR